MLIETANISSPFEWMSNHLQLIGWPAVCYAAWRIGRFFKAIEDRATVAEGHVIKMATNDMPHMGAALEDIKKSNVSIDESLKTMVSRTPKQASRAKASR